MSPRPASNGGKHGGQAEAGRPLLAVIRARWRLVLLLSLLVPLVALAVSLTQEKQYTAGAVILLGDPASATKKDELIPATDQSRAAQTALELSRTTKVARKTANLVGQIGTDEVTDAVQVSASPTSDLVDVEATASDPELAADIANSFAEVFVKFRRQVSNLQIGGAEVVEEATVPDSPSAPNTIFNVLLGLAIGIPLAIGLAVVLDRLDNRVHDAAEFEELLGAPLLGRVPKSKEIASGSPLDALPPEVTEAFQMVRANLSYLGVDRTVRSVMVTSAAPEDGKSTLAFNLAAAAARAGKNALLIEADLRSPSLTEAIAGSREGGGLVGYLAGNPALEKPPNVLRRTVDAESGATVDLLLAAAVPPNPPLLLESERMKELLGAVRRSYELVIVDSPPLPVVSDGVGLLDSVDGVIVIGRAHQDRREALVELRDQLDQLGANVLGVVVNFCDPQASRYRGYGSYPYGESTEAAQAEPAGEQAPAAT